MKRLSLSFATLIGSAILFVFVSFAWFTVSEFVEIPLLNSGVANFDTRYEIYESGDDSNYELVEDISFDVLMPGQTLYYQIIVSNLQDRTINAEVFFIGFTDVYSDGMPSTSEYSLKDTIYMTSEVNSQIIINQSLLSDLLINQSNPETSQISVSDEFIIDPLSTVTVYLQFTVDNNTGNAYQDLGIDIGDIYIALKSMDVAS
ncbi:hypothetical protein KHQ88_02080 [Mycoplasmatota bacterium]|nr:hypothetical protein KHQ88_02080 [Mycoplasmatota bacterium]